MNTLTLPIPLTIPQLADLLRQQLTPAQRRELTALMLDEQPVKSVAKPAKAIAKTKKAKDELPSVADDLREAILELNQYRRGEIQLPTMQEFLDEL